LTGQLAADPALLKTPALLISISHFPALGRPQAGLSFAPRQIPHMWAYTGGIRGSILIAFTPAGKMESFFREVTKVNAMPAQDPNLWRAHDMELLGPPLKLE
jgi:hypothetical protein